MIQKFQYHEESPDVAMSKNYESICDRQHQSEIHSCKQIADFPIQPNNLTKPRRKVLYHQ
jgi:hypothetical protein